MGFGSEEDLISWSLKVKVKCKNNEQVIKVDDVIFLGSKIQKDGYGKHDERRHLLLGRTCLVKMHVLVLKLLRGVLVTWIRSSDGQGGLCGHMTTCQATGLYLQSRDCIL